MYVCRYWNNPELVNQRYSNRTITTRPNRSLKHTMEKNSNALSSNSSDSSSSGKSIDYNETRLNEVILDIQQCNKNIILACENIDSFNEFQVNIHIHMIIIIVIFITPFSYSFTSTIIITIAMIISINIIFINIIFITIITYSYTSWKKYLVVMLSL